MAIKKELFINALQMVEVDERENIPTAVLFDKSGSHVGYQAVEAVSDVTELNENFKLNLGKSAPSRLDPPRFDTGDGKTRSAHEITKVFIEGVLKSVTPWVIARGLKPAKRVLVAEPLALDRTDINGSDWLANYRAKLKAILTPFFEEVDFLPEPFAVFQYYRYGVRHPLLTSNTRHAALVIDFGGGTFDVSVVDTTATGDVSGSGRNSRPLAAASFPVGGSFINFLIARDLIAKNLEKGIDKSKVGKGWEAYRDGADTLCGYQGLRDDLRQFVRNAKRVISQVEKAKLHICDTLADWALDAQYEPGPAMQISIPKNPFAAQPEMISLRFDAYQLRDIFIKHVWQGRLKAAMDNAISRAKDELGGRPINIVLLSGGSANIRWLTKLVEELLPRDFPDAEILELQGSFQEVVSKGLAIECARRTFNQGTSDFQSVTYNRLCLVIGADGEVPTATRFRPTSENKSNGTLGDGTLLESAFLIGSAQEKPLRWKFRLSSPPKRHLDYYFLKSSLDFDDISSLHNIDHRVATPKNTAFDSQIVLELTVAADGTAHPKFVYRQGHSGTNAVFVEGKPFFLDMTYGEKTTVGEAYVGIDFGTSNSSISYVEQQAVKVYTERASDKGWRDLNDLVSTLPYPASNPLVRFIGSSNDRDVKDRFASAFESLLFTTLTIAYVDYRATPEAKKSSIFRNFTKGSAGPIWAVLRSVLEKRPKGSFFLDKLNGLLEDRTKVAINLAIEAINDHKHRRASTYQGHREILAVLGNTLNQALDGWRFGQFESVTKKGFSSQNIGLFRAAHGTHPPFVDIYAYIGPETFSEMEAVLVSPELKLAIRLSPFLFWTLIDARGEQTVAFLDSTSPDTSNYGMIAGGGAISISAASDLAELHRMCINASTSDACDGSAVCKGIQVTVR
jgi:hypothetical protein